MTLRECMIWTYAILILFNIGLGLLSLFVLEGTAFIFYAILIGYYALILYMLNKDMHFMKEIKIPASHFSAGINHMLSNAKN